MSAVLAEADSHGTWLEPLFDVAFAAPGGVARLRQLILTLALQGKLVPQLASEAPASELRKQIKVSRAEQAKAENLRTPKVNSPILSSEITFVLPAGWEWVRNGDLFALRKGKVPKELNETGEIPYLDIEALDRGNIRRYTNDYSVPMCTDEDILVVCDGSRSGLVLKGKNGAIGSTLSVIETPRFIQPFVRLIFQQGFQRLNSSMKGAAIPHLDTKNMLQDVVGLPPLEEQRRIVARVYELLAHCDEFERLRQQQCEKRAAARAATMRQWLNGDDAAAALLDKNFAILVGTREDVAELRKAILQLAVMGRLVAQDPADAPASELLKQIRGDKEALVRAGEIRASKPFAPIADSEKPYAIPENWEWVRLGEVGAFERGRSKHRPRNDKRLFENGTIPFVQTGDVSRSKFTRNQISTCTGYYSEFGLRQSRLWKKGTLCITIAANIAETGFLGMDACIPDSVVAFLSHDAIISRLVKVFIDVVKDDLEHYAPSTAQKNINLEIINELVFPLPPIEEQNRIVTRIDALMQLCDTLEQSIDAAQAKQIELLDAVMVMV
ncbi:restriction endonuclease subunit S [Pseudoxanthomonas mexicana]